MIDFFNTLVNYVANHKTIVTIECMKMDANSNRFCFNSCIFLNFTLKLNEKSGESTLTTHLIVRLD